MKDKIIVTTADGRTIEMPVNYQHFILDYSKTPEGKGRKKEDVEYVLECVREDRLEDLDFTADLMNDIGTFFDDGVCVKADVRLAVYWYEQAIEAGCDIARSNLADILRKGTHGYPKDQRRAFELYRDCGLPYAHYRVGECYELGRGVAKDLEMARVYYTQAYCEGHGLAIRKLREWNFLKIK